MSWGGDPIADFNRWDAERQRSEDAQPHCDKCGFPIWEGGYQCDDGRYICDECRYEEENEDFIKEYAKTLHFAGLVEE